MIGKKSQISSRTAIGSENETEFKEFLVGISEHLSFQLVMGENYRGNDGIDLWSPDYDRGPPKLAVWAEENLEKRWSYIYSNEHTYFFFETNQDMLKFIFEWCRD